MKNLLFIILCLTTNVIFGQNVKIEVSPNAEIGKPFTVQIISESDSKEVDVLDLDGLKTLGNSTSMSTVITNGKVQKSQSINLTVLAEEERAYKLSVAIMVDGVMEDMIEEIIQIGEAGAIKDTQKNETVKSQRETPKPTKPRTPRKLKRI